jgi:hypothetical protein
MLSGKNTWKLSALSTETRIKNRSSIRTDEARSPLAETRSDARLWKRTARERGKVVNMKYTGEIKRIRHGYYRVMLYRNNHLIFDYEVDDPERANAQIAKWQSLTN